MRGANGQIYRITPESTNRYKFLPSQKFLSSQQVRSHFNSLSSPLRLKVASPVRLKAVKFLQFGDIATFARKRTRTNKQGDKRAAQSDTLHKYFSLSEVHELIAVFR